MADPTIWSKLPLVLMPIIIQQTSEPSTLKALCESTRGSSYLHLLCLRETFRVYTIEKSDLLNAPLGFRVREGESDDDDDDDDEADEEDYDRDEALLDEEDDSSLFEPARSRLFYQEIGPHIKRLVLNFRFKSVETQDGLTKSEDIHYTLASLLSHASNLEEIDHDGVIYQELLDCLIATPSLKVFKARKTWVAQPCTLSNLPRRPNDLLLNWDKLGALSFLKTLHISHLFKPEAIGLASAIKGMHQLEDLHVAASSLLTPMGNSIASDEDSHLVTLLAALNRPIPTDKGEVPRGFPVSLKRLSLVDINALLTPAILPDLSNYASLVNLKHLYLDLLVGSATIYLLEIVKAVNLEHLSISYVPKTADRDWISLRDRLEDHSKSLKQITLLNAWLNFQPYKSDIDQPWSSFMDVCHVYLSEHPKTYFYRNEHNKLRWRVFGNNGSYTKWGSSVRRMRIDQVNLHDLEVNRIDGMSDGLQQLRILILRPLAEQVRDYLSSNSIRSLPYSYEPFGPELPDDVDLLNEGKIAQAIGAQDLPALRIIAVGRYRFWLEKLPISNANGSHRRKIWFLRHALQNAEQEAEILRVVNKEDWQFLSDRSDCLAQEAPQEHVREANRLVYRKKNV